MSTYKFKSVGKTATVIESEKVTVTRNPVGIKTPLKIDEKNIFAMHYNIADQMHDNLKNLLLTNWGERLGLYEFGANLKELTSEYTDIGSFEDEAIQRIRNAVTKWMPFISLQNFAASIDREKNAHVGILKILITYNIDQLEIKDKALQISMYVS